MTSARSTRRQVGFAATWIMSTLGLWIAAAWLGRQSVPSPAALTDPVFALALVWTYVAGWSVAGALSHDSRRAAFRSTAVTLALLVGVLIGEVPAYSGLIDYRLVREALTEPGTPDISFVEDRELSFRRAPHFHWSGRHRPDIASYLNLPIRASHTLTFSTDRDGFRNRQEIDRADIVLIGDSYVEGFAVSDEDTVAARLHQISGVVVKNLGMSGYGSLQELRVLKKFGLTVAPRLVAWFFFEGNDLDDDQTFENALVAYEGPKEATPAARPDASAGPPRLRWQHFVERSFTRNVFLQIRRMTDRLVPNSGDSYGWFRDRDDDRTEQLFFYDFYAARPFGEYERQRFETTQAALREAQAICRAHNIQLVVFYAPIKFRVYRDVCMFPPGSPCPQWRSWDLETRFMAFCRSAGIDCISLTEPMRRAARTGELLYGSADSHWNERGDAFVAQQVKRVWDAAHPPVTARE